MSERETGTAVPADEVAMLDELARALADVGRAVRDAVRGPSAHDRRDDGVVVRTEGGDDVYGVDQRAEEALVAAMASLGARWPGTAVIEGRDDPVAVGAPEVRGAADPVGAPELHGAPDPIGAPDADSPSPWRYLVDPVDGTRPYLAGKRSAWVLLGAGRDARTLEDLEVGAAVEIPTGRAAVGRVAWAVRGHPARATDDDLVGGGPSVPVVLEPRRDATIDRGFVTVVRYQPGDHGPIGAWLDQHLAGLEVYDDLVPCSAQHLMGVASGSDVAVLDPRPLFNPAGMATHPYDLAALVVARSAGAIVEALPPGPLDHPLDTTTPVAWAAYANDAVAARLRPRAADLPAAAGER